MKNQDLNEIRALLDRIKGAKVVVIESPLAGNVERNQRYLDACILDCIRRGETPYASHKMLVGALDDLKPEEREAGIAAGFKMAEALWHGCSAPRVFYLDVGVSSGMMRGAKHALELAQRTEERRLGGEWAEVAA